MKHVLLLFSFLIFSATSSYAVVHVKWQQMVDHDERLQELPPEVFEEGLATFLSITPRDFKEKTGERLGIVNSIKLKMAQKYVKANLDSGDADISEGVYILLAILGLAWIAMGLMDDWSGNNWIINLILSFLCWLPGLIHALVKKSEYY
ncbi:MAG: YqaE/Pmp3 family membrane protein [Saprospiraceae bacterium]|nr:YqaE/Pmp3 family membrane protein [Saprospiraceae bacterium]